MRYSAAWLQSGLVAEGSSTSECLPNSTFHRTQQQRQNRTRQSIIIIANTHQSRSIIIASGRFGDFSCRSVAFHAAPNNDTNKWSSNFRVAHVRRRGGRHTTILSIAGRQIRRRRLRSQENRRRCHGRLRAQALGHFVRSHLRGSLSRNHPVLSVRTSVANCRRVAAAQKWYRSRTNHTDACLCQRIGRHGTATVGSRGAGRHVGRTVHVQICGRSSAESNFPFATRLVRHARCGCRLHYLGTLLQQKRRGCASSAGSESTAGRMFAAVRWQSQEPTNVINICTV